MTEPSVIAPGCGEVVADAPDRRVEILSDDASLHVTWSRFGPGREGADLHVHRRHTDLFYVLDGELTISLGLHDEAVVVSAGTLARIPPLVVHGFRNASDADVRYLNLHAPGQGFAGYMRARRDGRDDGYDQHPPPPGVGRPVRAAVFCPPQPTVGTAVLADVPEIRVAETSAVPGASPEELHDSQGYVVSFYVLAGEPALTIARREARVRAGTWIQAPPGVPCSLALQGTEPARFLSLRTPVAPPA